MNTRLFFACALLKAAAYAEERPIMDGATMIQRDISPIWNQSSNAICDGGYASLAITTGDDVSGGKGQKEIVITLSEAKRIKHAFVQNRGDVNKRRVGESALYVGEDTGAFSAGMTKCSDDFYDSGFYSVKCTTQGKNVAIRRNGPYSLAPNLYYNINEVRLYQTPNLLELPFVTISAPAPTAPQWAATNLISNFTRRTSVSSQKPLIDWASNTATWESCYKTGAAQLSVEGNKLVINVDLGKSYFQHAVLVVQDLLTFDPLKSFQNFELYIGDSPNYAENPKCARGPHLQVGDPNSYVYNKNVTQNWRYGKEVWCNMEGRFMTIVADLTHLAGQLYETSLCHLAVFGALYSRTTPVTPSLKVQTGTPYELDVEKITADATTPIANTLDIMLRQKAGTELPWVTFSQDTLVTKVNIAPDPTVPPGDYTIVLESFDKAGGVYSALKTDRITVTVQGCPISADQVTALAESLAADPLNISVTAHKVGSTQVGFQHKYDQIVKQLAFDATKQQQCGPISVDLVSKHASLMNVPNTKSLFLRADDSTEPGVFEDSFLNIHAATFSFKIPIRVEFTGCVVTSLSFEPSLLKISYQVGSGSLSTVLPNVVQKPDCGLDLAKNYIKKIDSGSISAESVQAAVKLDQATRALVVATDDASFVGKNISVTVAIEATGTAKLKDLIASLQFGASSVTKPASESDQEQTQPTASDEMPSNSPAATTNAAASQKSEVEVKFEKNLSAELGMPDLVVPRVTKEQAAILSTPIDKLTTEELFSYVPLAARLSAGLEQANAYRLQQREAFKQKIAAAAAAGKPRPPESRFQSFSASGDLKFKFTSKLKFSDDSASQVKRQLELGPSHGQQKTDLRTLFEIVAVPGVYAKGEVSAPIMESWSLVSLREDEVEFKIHFFNPLQVSALELPDQLIVQMMLSEFKDENGNSFPASMVNYVSIPRQMASEAEAAKVQSSGESTQSALLANLVLNTAIAHSADQLWSFVNNLQVVMKINLFDIKQPGNVNEFNEFFAEITSLKGIEKLAECVIDSQFYFPDIDPKSANFRNAGYTTPFFVKNAKEMLVVLGSFFSLTLTSIVLWLPAKCSVRTTRWHSKMHDRLFWNGFIRLLMEVYADIMLFLVLNLNEMEWPANDTTSVTANNRLTWFFLCVSIVAPTFLFQHLWRKHDLHVSNDDAYNTRLGAFLEGTSRKKDKKCAVFIVPVAFFAKRLSLGLTLVLWADFFWGQQAVQFALAIAMIIFIQHAKPFSTHFQNNLETFNEVFNLLIQYQLMMFTDFVRDPVTRHLIGNGYIGTLAIYLAINVYFLFRDTVHDSKMLLRLKRCLFHRKWCMWCFTSKLGCLRNRKTSDRPKMLKDRPADKEEEKKEDNHPQEEEKEEQTKADALIGKFRALQRKKEVLDVQVADERTKPMTPCEAMFLKCKAEQRAKMNRDSALLMNARASTLGLTEEKKNELVESNRFAHPDLLNISECNECDEEDKNDDFLRSDRVKVSAKLRGFKTGVTPNRCAPANIPAPATVTRKLTLEEGQERYERLEAEKRKQSQLNMLLKAERDRVIAQAMTESNEKFKKFFQEQEQRRKTHESTPSQGQQPVRAKPVIIRL